MIVQKCFFKKLTCLELIIIDFQDVQRNLSALAMSVVVTFKRYGTEQAH